jgi:4'-phosphopantetheinyl transferase
MGKDSCVRVYAILADGGFRYDEAALSAARREKIVQIKSPEAKVLSAAADFALSFALCETVPGFAPPPALSYDETGRPRVPGAFVSLSHTRGLAACAVSDTPVGLDAERERPMNAKIAPRVLSPDEMTEFCACGDQNDFLLLKWVTKEAYLKLTGEGIAGGMHKYTEKEGLITDAGNRIRAYVRRPILPGYRIAVCQFQPFTCELIHVPNPA